MVDNTSSTGPVETKVKASGAAALLAGIIVAWLVTKVPAIADLSEVLKVIIAGVLTAAPTVIAGWFAPHTPR